MTRCSITLRHRRPAGAVRPALIVSTIVALTAAAPTRAADSLLDPGALHHAGYAPYYDVHIPLSHAEHIVAARLVDDNIYLTTDNGLIFAVQADTGLVRWTQSLGDRPVIANPPFHVRSETNDGPVVFVIRKSVLIFDRYSGTRLRRIDLPFLAAGGATADILNIYLGSADGRLYALRWLSTDITTPLLRWAVGINGHLATTPELSPDNLLFFITDTGVVYCVGAADKALIWAYRTGSPSVGQFDADAGRIFFATTHQRLYALDKATGRQLASRILPDRLISGPILYDDVIYQPVRGQGLFALGVDEFNIIWTQRAADRFISRTGDRLILQARNHDLLLAARSDGRILARLPIPENARPLLNRNSDTLFVVSRDGRLAAARPLDAPYLKLDDFLAARAGLRKSPTPLRGRADQPMPSIDLTDPEQPTIEDPLRSTEPPNR